jgi:ketosteroid isomerase-like protein
MQLVQTMIDAFDHRDVEELVAHMTEDVVLRPSAFITGTGEYLGRDGVRSGMETMIKQLGESRERVRVTTSACYFDAEDDDRVLTLASVTVLRETGEEFGTEPAYLWTLRDGLVCEIQALRDHDEGLSRLAAPVEVERLG